VKKIISILLALGLVLGLTVMAVPTAAQPPCATVTGTAPFCASATDTYNITFTSAVTLLSGNDKLSVEFGAGTTFGTFVLGDVKVKVNADAAVSVPLASIEAAAPGLKFLLPIGVNIAPGDTVSVAIAKVINPATAGTYSLCLDYQLVCCDAVVFCCVDYIVAPAISEYDFSFDFSPTYPGLKAGYVPPMKACGQNDSGQDPVTGFNTTEIGGVFYDQFDLIFGTTIVGCATPCDNVTVTVGLVDAPAGATVDLVINGTSITLDLNPATLAIEDQDDIDVVTLSENMTPGEIWPSLIHVDSVGDYTICFYADCGAPPPCSEGGGIIADECMEFHAYQWKDAYQIPLYRKWNLVSLPLVPFVTDIDTMLDAYPLEADIQVIWYYDRCANKWSSYKGGGLTDMVDGNSYWVKVDYSHTNPAKAPGLYHGCLWVWGVAAPMPPDAPSAYAVCEGWNMVGFRSMVTRADELYLVNFWDAAATWPDYGMIYEWNASAQNWVFGAPATVDMTPGVGYWIPFEVDGTIYP